MSEHHPHVPGQPIEERAAVKMGILWASAIGLATLIVVSMGLMRAFQLALSKGAPHVQPVDVNEPISLLNRSAPLSATQRAARIEYEQEQAEILKSYTWLDQKHDLARIPIDRAMQIVVQQYGKTE